MTAREHFNQILLTSEQYHLVRWHHGYRHIFGRDRVYVSKCCRPVPLGSCDGTYKTKTSRIVVHWLDQHRWTSDAYCIRGFCWRFTAAGSDHPQQPGHIHAKKMAGHAILRSRAGVLSDRERLRYQDSASYQQCFRYTSILMSHSNTTLTDFISRHSSHPRVYCPLGSPVRSCSQTYRPLRLPRNDESYWLVEQWSGLAYWPSLKHVQHAWL